MNRKRIWVWIILVLVAVAIKVFSLYPSLVERFYALGAYPVISRLQRICFGWIPFSIGDIFYLTVAIYLIYKLIILIRDIRGRKLSRDFFYIMMRRLVFVLLLIYIVFNLLWGLNYNRLGIAYQTQVPVQKYSTEDLQAIVGLIVNRLNSLDSAALANRNQIKNKKLLFAASIQSYRELSRNLPVFSYASPSVKSSLFSYLGNWLGFTGYYNPFSGEAQVNTTVPLFIQPFTSCHEMGHQLGYAKENEANIAGYLSAKSSTDPAFRYSVYFDLYLYAASELYVRDSLLLKPLRGQISAGVRKDFKELQQFWKIYSNPIEPYIRRLYGKYLRANEQPQGIMSYNEVIAWLIAYYKKNGAQSI
jgi:hypothetical protein